jgi:hypothetical protein
MSFDPVDRHVMCFAHIVDLSTGRVIREFETANDHNKGGGDDALSNPISLARSVVGIVRASGTRRDAYDGIIKEGNAKGWFAKAESADENGRLNHLQLLRDVPTRWDSVYYMIERLRVMHPVRFKFC